MKIARLLRSLTAMVVAVAMPTSVIAAIIPFGIQTNITQANIDNWGFTECHRSVASNLVQESAVTGSCSGDYLMMAVWDVAEGVYNVAAAGEYGVVTDQTLFDYQSDNNLLEYHNWSNGVNWYRTEQAGSWGFTNGNEIILHSADVLLHDSVPGNDVYKNYGTCAYDGSDCSQASIGLSFHTNGGSLTSGWGFNDGDGFEYASSSHQRVFFAANFTPNDIPEPGSLALMAFAALMIGRRKLARKS